MVDLLNYFLFQPVLHNWCYKGHTVSGMVHIKDSLLLIEKEEPTKAGTCARDRRALQQLALNVHVKHSDMT